MDRTLKCDHSFIGKLLSSTLLWGSLFFDFSQFVILESLSVFDLALSGVKGLKHPLNRCFSQEKLTLLLGLF